MTPTQYQEFTRTTAVYPKDKAIEYLALGLAGEAGEVAGKVKKAIRDANGIYDPYRKAMIADEVGDILWYCARLLDELEVDLGYAMQHNKEKLQSRKERGTIQGDGDIR